MCDGDGHHSLCQILASLRLQSTECSAMEIYEDNTQ